MMRHDISLGVWESKRALITKLYKEEEWPLKQVIRVIQTDTFRPSETQLRVRLKKWHVTKPSRKKYCSGKAASTETNANDMLSSQFGLTQEPDGGSLPLDPTPNAIRTVALTPPHDLPISNGLLDTAATPDNLDSLYIALDDYLRASCLLPTTRQPSPPFSTISNLTPHDDSSNMPTIPNLGQRVTTEDYFQATSTETSEQSSRAEERDFPVMEHTCVRTEHGSRLGAIVPSATPNSESLAQQTLISTNLTIQRDGDACIPIYAPESWCLPHVSPFEQYRTGLALCQQALPRLTQRDRCILGFHPSKANEHHGAGNLLCSNTCAVLPLSFSQAHTMGSADFRPCPACLDFPLL